MNTRVAHAYLGAGLILIAAFLTQGPLAAGAIEASVTVSATVAVIVGIRRNRTTRPRAWNLFVLGLLLFAVEQLSWIIDMVGTTPVPGSMQGALDLAGYLALLAGAVVTLRARARQEIGGVLDAAVLAVATGTIPWEFVIHSQLTAVHTGMAALALNLTEFLLVVAALGVLLRLARTSTGSPATVFYLFAATCAGFAQIVGYTVVNGTAGHLPGSPVEAAGMLAVLCIGAAALHPEMARLTEPGPVVADHMSTRRLLTLGAAMIIGPISVGVWQLLGHPADLVLLVLSPISTVPLVVFRIQGLVTQRAAAETALAHQAMHDSLTGLPNRAQFINLLDAALHRVRTGTSTEIAVLFCDLNGFKHVNDTLGHGAGDHLLVAVAARLQGCLRGHDVVSRFGGDEFLVLCENRTSAEIAERVSGRITNELRRPITVGATEITIGASIGVAAATTAGDLTAEEIIQDADVAMYTAKRAATAKPRLDPGTDKGITVIPCAMVPAGGQTAGHP
jgi:diguanylate cyclase (GGDEF)-like protein